MDLNRLNRLNRLDVVNRLGHLYGRKPVYGPVDRRRHPRHPETSAQAEAEALTAALPLRPMLGCLDGAMRYVLGCGHTVSSNSLLDEEARVRCRECYREGIVLAEKMILDSALPGDE